MSRAFGPGLTQGRLVGPESQGLLLISDVAGKQRGQQRGPASHTSNRCLKSNRKSGVEPPHSKGDYFRVLRLDGAFPPSRSDLVVAAHGYPRFTGDQDVWIQSSSENAKNVFQACHRFCSSRTDKHTSFGVDTEIDRCHATALYGFLRKPC